MVKATSVSELNAVLIPVVVEHQDTVLLPNGTCQDSDIFGKGIHIKVSLIVFVRLRRVVQYVNRPLLKTIRAHNPNYSISQTGIRPKKL